MEIWIKGAWLLLALIHATPAAVLFAPELATRLYSVSPSGGIGVLLIHRGAMFVALVVAAIFAMFDPSARRLATIVIAISMISFLVVYARADMPTGALRTIALVDLIGLLPLALVSFIAWRGQAGTRT